MNKEKFYEFFQSTISSNNNHACLLVIDTNCRFSNSVLKELDIIFQKNHNDSEEKLFIYLLDITDYELNPLKEWCMGVPSVFTKNKIYIGVDCFKFLRGCLKIHENIHVELVSVSDKITSDVHVVDDDDDDDDIVDDNDVVDDIDSLVSEESIERVECKIRSSTNALEDEIRNMMKDRNLV